MQCKAHLEEDRVLGHPGRVESVARGAHRNDQLVIVHTEGVARPRNGRHVLPVDVATYICTYDTSWQPVVVISSSNYNQA